MHPQPIGPSLQERLLKWLYIFEKTIIVDIEISFYIFFIFSDWLILLIMEATVTWIIIIPYIKSNFLTN